MPVTIKAANLKYKDTNGEYVGVNSISDMTTAEQLAAIEQAGTTNKNAIDTAGANHLSAINTAGNNHLSAINTAGTTQTTAVNNAGATQVAAVNSAGTTQVAAVQDKGDEVLESIPSDYSELTEDVNSLKSALDGKQDAPTVSGTAGQVLGLDENLDPTWVDQTGGGGTVDDSALAPVIKSTASGEIASFTDGAENRLIDSLVVNIEPVQDLHGQEYPYPAGGGPNLWGGTAIRDSILTAKPSETADDEAKTITIRTGQGTTIPTLSFKENTRYTLILTCSNSWGNATNMEFVYTDGTYSNVSGLSGANTKATLVKTSKANKTLDHIATTSQAGITTIYYEESGLFEGVLTANQFAPYENICPISGWTGATVVGTGKNLATAEKIVLTENGTYQGITAQRTDGCYTLSGTATSSGIKFFGGFKNYPYRTVDVLANQVYVISYMQTGGFHIQGNILDKNNKQIVASNNTWITPSSKTDSTTGRNYAVFVPSANGRIAFIITASLTQGAEYNGSISDIQLELASAPSEYELYAGQTYEVSFPSEAGTVYGGKLDVTGGELISAMAKKVFSFADIALRILNNSGSGVNIYRMRMQEAYGNTLISNQYKQFPSVNDATANGSGIAIGNRSGSNLYISVVFPYVEGDTNETADARLLANELYVLYELVEPQTYHFDNVGQFYTHLGVNNIWADCGSIESVEYSVDTKLYIDGKITEAIAAALNA